MNHDLDSNESSCSITVIVAVQRAWQSIPCELLTVMELSLCQSATCTYGSKYSFSISIFDGFSKPGLQQGFFAHLTCDDTDIAIRLLFYCKTY